MFLSADDCLSAQSALKLKGIHRGKKHCWLFPFRIASSMTEPLFLLQAKGKLIWKRFNKSQAIFISPTATDILRSYSDGGEQTHESNSNLNSHQSIFVSSQTTLNTLTDFSILAEIIFKIFSSSCIFVQFAALCHLPSNGMVISSQKQFHDRFCLSTSGQSFLPQKDLI